MRPDAPDPTEYFDNPIPDRHSGAADTLSTVLRGGCILVGVVFTAICGLAAVLALLLLSGVVHLSDLGVGARELPDFGRPADTKQLENDGSFCSIGAPWCRILAFGGRTPFSVTREQLAAAYKKHGWEITSNDDDVVLKVASKSHSTCISYRDIRPDGDLPNSQFPPDWRGFDVVIYVIMVPCSSADAH